MPQKILKVKKKVKKKKARRVIPKRTEVPTLNVAFPAPLPTTQLLGNYSNRAVISHTRLEFLLDFLLAFESQTILASRVITSPEHAKQLYEALGQNIRRYEKIFGQITVE